MYDTTATRSSSALVAVFSSSETAREAVHRLHDEGFHETWIGITRAADNGAGSGHSGGETVVESENAVARFFGAGDEPLHEALLKHGVSTDDAVRLDGSLPIDSAILTVEGTNHPELAAQIISECGGDLMNSSGTNRLYDSYREDATDTTPALSRDRLAELGNYSAGEALDEPRRLQLREERLSVNKRVEQTGEATIGKRVVTERTDIDVPVYHEELYIERRPASGTYDNVGEIGDSETIRVPLQAERAVVDKRTVVTSEVAVGQRRVDDVEHVSETLRKEELDVQQGAQGIPSR